LVLPQIWEDILQAMAAGHCATLCWMKAAENSIFLPTVGHVPLCRPINSHFQIMLALKTHHILWLILGTCV
jgi:hypothetical protein